MIDGSINIIKSQFEGYSYHRNRSHGVIKKTAPVCVFPFLAVRIMVVNRHDGWQTDTVLL